MPSEIDELIGVDAVEAILRISAQDGDGRRARSWRPSSPIPPPHGRPRRAAARADLRLLLRPVPRRGRVSCASSTAASHKERSARSSMRTEAYEVSEVGVFTPDMLTTDSWQPARSATSSPGIKKVGELKVGDTVTDARAPAAAAAARLPRGQADGLLRPVPDRRRRLHGPARRAREAAAQRCLASLRARELRRRWASASAAGSSACCTWRSSRSAWSASTTSS